MGYPAPRIRGLPPSIAPDVRLLILGSLPSAVSLAQKGYYANPLNRFWRIMEALLGTPLVHATAPERLAVLTASGIGLWDVASSAERRGSMDSDIRSADLADVPGRAARLPDLKVIAFNGRHAFELAKPWRQDVPAEMIALPSTSPASRLSFEVLLARWEVLLEWLPQAGTRGLQWGSMDDRTHAAPIHVNAQNRSTIMASSADFETIAQMLADSQKGYSEAAEIAEDTQIKQMFMDRAQARQSLLTELAPHLPVRDAADVGDGTVAGGAHRVFLNLRRLVQDDTRVALSEVERGESAFLDKLSDALNDNDLSGDERMVVTRLHEEVSADHDRFASMKATY